MSSPRPASSSPQAPTEDERTDAERARTDAGVALARFDALSRTRDGHRRRAGLVPLGDDPAVSVPSDWAEDRATELVSAGHGSERLTPDRASEQARQLLWWALFKILGALVAAAIGIAVAVAIFSGMEG